MAKLAKSESAGKLVTLLQDLLIVELAKAGIPQPKIRAIAAVDMNRVSRIARHIKGSGR